MRRWNGWGDETVTVPVQEQALRLLATRLQPGTPPHDVTLATVLTRLPASRLPAHPLISSDPGERLRHARGQSFPDLIALRSGAIPAVPDGVAYPLGNGDVRALLAYAREVGAQVIPYGGGTSVVGHINPLPGPSPVLTVDLSRLSRLHHLDESSLLATFGAGVCGPDLEAQLRARGYTLGHFPQSFELSTLGGWIATRSRGQQSLGYGRIEHLFAGGRLEAPAGTLELRPFPASSTGPDLRELVLGSEGRLGILTEATVRVHRVPAHEVFHALVFPAWAAAHQAARAMIQAEVPLSMLRLSTPRETATTLTFAGHARLIGVLERSLALRGIGAEKCLLLAGFSGSAAQVNLSRKTVLDVAHAHGGVHLGQPLGRQWQRTRFQGPYLRNELWSRGYGVDTVETATGWENVPIMVEAVETALRTALADCGEQVHAFTHLSHLYPQGSSVYTTYIFRLGAGADETLARWQRLKTAASQAIVRHGGTISHQHGVGTDHRPYLGAEKGALGLAAIRGALAAFDPDGLLNPGKLV